MRCMNVCYIRYDGRLWERAASHHMHALQSYLSLYLTEPGQIPVGGDICAVHESGGIFYGYFTHLHDSVYQFEDLQKNKVAIMMATPERVAIMNRMWN